MSEEINVVMSLIGDEVINIDHALASRSAQEHRHDRSLLHTALARYLGSIPKVVVVGAGGIGAWVAHFLAVSDVVEELHLYDSDKIEAHNHSRFLFPPEMTGHSKVHALAAMLKMSRPDALIISQRQDFTIDELEVLRNEGLRMDEGVVGDMRQELRAMMEPDPVRRRTSSPSPFNMDGPVMQQLISEDDLQLYPLLIIDTTDNVEFQRTMSNRCHELLQEHMDEGVRAYRNGRRFARNVPVPVYVRASYNGIDHITITRRFSEFGADQAQGRYDVIPSFPFPAILAAIYAVYGGLQAIQDAQYEVAKHIIQTISSERRFGTMLDQIRTGFPWLKYYHEPESRRETDGPPGRYRPRMCNIEHNCYGQALYSDDKKEAHEAMMECVPSLYPTIVNGDNTTRLSIKRGLSHGMGQFRVRRVLSDETSDSPDDTASVEQDPRDDGIGGETGMAGVPDNDERGTGLFRMSYVFDHGRIPRFYPARDTGEDPTTT